MEIRRATAADVPSVQHAYDHARQTQRQQGSSVWLDFPDTLLRAEIERGLLWCVVDDEAVVGAFTMAYEDPLIWGERERQAHIYLHRVARTAEFRGAGLMDVVLAWARAECRARGREAVRLDTWATNAPLVAYYMRKGFRLVERRRVGPDPRLPAHYTGIELALLEDTVGCVPPLR